MWAIRVLSGPQAGQVFPLKPGKNTIGRAPGCEIKINSGGVSKEHASVLVTEDKLILTDLNSRNGTFVNGVRIQNQRLDGGDKVSLHDVIVDIIPLPKGAQLNQPHYHGAGGYVAPMPAWAGNAALRLQQTHQQAAQPYMAADPNAQPHMQLAPEMNPHQPLPEPPPAQMSAGSAGDLFNNFRIYIDNVAMPGVYQVAQNMPYRYALAILVILFIVTVTALSTVPMASVTKQSIRQESVRRAKTIARNLAATNRQAIIEKNDIAVSVRAAELEEGVTDALIISAKDGTIIAPANKRGEFANKPFVNQARREERETDGFIDDSKLGVAVPITYFNPDVGNQSVIAYAIVLYDMGALAMNSSQTFSLFIQTLAISLLAGALLYFFLLKVVEHPLVAMNAQLDDALRDGRDDLSTPYQYPVLETLASNINSALSRIGRGSEPGMPLDVVVNRDIEASNIVRMLLAAAVTVNAIDERVIATNSTFDQLVGGGLNLQGRPLTDIPDPALQENLRDLLPKMRASLSEIALSEIPFFGNTYEVCGQAIMGGSEPAYFLITLNRIDGEG